MTLRSMNRSKVKKIIKLMVLLKLICPPIARLMYFFSSSEFSNRNEYGLIPVCVSLISVFITEERVSESKCVLASVRVLT